MTNSRIGKIFPAYNHTVDVMVSYGNHKRYGVVSADGWDLGAPLGEGNTVREAVTDFIEEWLLKFDELIRVRVTCTKVW